VKDTSFLVSSLGAWVEGMSMRSFLKSWIEKKVFFYLDERFFIY
jgi:hypothetical protein